MPKNLRKRNKTWFYRFKHGGKCYTGSLRTDDLTIAKERFERIQQQLIQSDYGERPRRTFDEAALRFAEEHYQTLKPKSRKRYGVSFDSLVKHFAGKHLDEIGSALLGDFERARLKQRVTTSTVRRDLACLSSVFSRAEEWEWISYNPIKPYIRGRTKAGLKEGNPKTRWLTVEEEKALLAVCSSRMQDLVAFAIDTGLRKEEIFSLQLNDVNLKTNELTVREDVSKNGKSRTIPLLPRAREIYLKSKRSKIGRAFVFTTPEGQRYSEKTSTLFKALQRASRRAKIPHVGLHDLRRTCGCRLLQDYRMSMEEVALWLGHSSVRITERHYAFLRVNDLHKALQVAKSWPKIPQ